MTDDPRFTAAFWDDRYSSAERLWSGNPNPALVEEVSGLTPGRALEAGCGEGADSIWLARQGWTVTGTDVSRVALERAAVHTPPELAGRLTWRWTDVLDQVPETGAYGLVFTAFLHLPSAVRRQVFAGLAEAVAPGGSLVVVAHHPRDLDEGAVPRPPEPDLFYTADELAEDLVPVGGWQVRTRAARPRTVTHEGRE
ncbi:bifunctional 2-polyprenyl-6-hydroxyphenol methylase/3-demethylubiquinol 3-O-methyltransferase UbiG, partial [Streptomyces sp. UH6]|uniref:class I SAM-dependent methyltransferase n=1 Tax=Streptomyces sp. UH6 TaxID=2748379 RepID=UPI0015D47264